MKRINIFLFVLITSILSLFSSSNGFSSESRFFLDRVVAVVNRDVITWSELYKFMEFSSQEQVQKMTVEEKFKYFKGKEEEYLERLIDTKLQIEEAEKYGITASDREIDSTIDEIKKKYGLSDKEFEENLKKEGLTLSDYRKLLREQIIIGRVLNTIVRPKVIVSEADINSYISSNPQLSCDEEGFYISQIFVRIRENQEEFKNKVNHILSRLVQGEQFSKVASELSEDLSAKTGGAIGLLKKKEISQELVSLFSKMSPGQISEPMVTNTGVYIFRLDGLCFKRNSEELINYVRTQLEEQKLKREHRLWVRSLRQRSYIEIMD